LSRPLVSDLPSSYLYHRGGTVEHTTQIIEGRSHDRCTTRGRPLPEVVILCDFCDQPADTIHFVPGVTDEQPGCRRQIRAACSKHDLGGYRLPVEQLARAPWRFVVHLATKRQQPHVQLIEWLDYDGGEALDTIRRAQA